MVIWNERNLSSCCLLHAIKLCWWELQGWILSRMIRTLDPASFPYKWSLADPMQRCEVVQKGGCTSHGQCEKDSVSDFLNHGFAFPTLGDQFPFHVSFTKKPLCSKSFSPSCSLSQVSKVLPCKQWSSLLWAWLIFWLVSYGKLMSTLHMNFKSTPTVLCKMSPLLRLRRILQCSKYTEMHSKVLYLKCNQNWEIICTYKTEILLSASQR